MTDKETIKALECCIEDYSCKQCPYDQNCDAMYTDTLSLINRQKAEIERLSKENNHFADIGKMYSEIRAEARSEAIKEFLKKQEIELANNTDISAAGYQSVIELNIKILKEMTGDIYD